MLPRARPSGIVLRGSITGAARDFASWSTPDGRPRPLVCSIGLSRQPLAAVSFPGLLLRFRLLWGDSGTPAQSLDFDMQSCVIVQFASSIRLQAYAVPELRSSILAGTAPTVMRWYDEIPSTVMMGVASSRQATRGLTLTQPIEDVVGDTYMADVPAWARTVGVWEGRAPGPGNYGLPTAYGGLRIQRNEGALTRMMYDIPIAECWRRFAPLGPCYSVLSTVRWSGEFGPSGAVDQQVVFGLEV